MFPHVIFCTTAPARAKITTSPPPPTSTYRRRKSRVSAAGGYPRRRRVKIRLPYRVRQAVLRYNRVTGEYVIHTRDGKKVTSQRRGGGGGCCKTFLFSSVERRNKIHKYISDACGSISGGRGGKKRRETKSPGPTWQREMTCRGFVCRAPVPPTVPARGFSQTVTISSDERDFYHSDTRVRSERSDDFTAFFFS